MSEIDPATTPATTPVTAPEPVVAPVALTTSAVPMPGVRDPNTGMFPAWVPPTGAPPQIAVLVKEFADAYPNPHTSSEYSRLCRRFFDRLDWSKPLAQLPDDVVAVFLASQDSRERSAVKRFVQAGFMDRLGIAGLQGREQFVGAPRTKPPHIAPHIEGVSEHARTATHTDGGPMSEQPAPRTTPTPRSRISAWYQGGERVRFFRPGTGELASHPRVQVGLPAYTDDDLRGASDATEFVSRFLVPQFGPQPGEEAVVYVAEFIDKANRVVGERQIPIQPPRRPLVRPIGERPLLPHQSREPLSQLEQESLTRAREDAANARALSRELQDKARAENDALRKQLEAKEKELAEARLPPPTPPPVMGDFENTAVGQAMAMSTRLNEHLMTKAAAPAGDMRQLADVLLAAFKPVIDLATRAATPSQDTNLAMMEKMHALEIKLLEQKISEKRHDDPDIDRMAASIEKIVGLGKRLAGGDEGGPSNPGVEVVQAIGEMVGEIAHSPVAQAIARNAGMAAVPSAPAPAPKALKPAALPRAVQHALRGMVEAQSDDEFQGALFSLVQGLASAGGAWEAKAEAIGVEFQKIETFEELQILIFDVLRGLGSANLLKEHPGFAGRATAAIARKYSEIHQVLTGQPKVLLGMGEEGDEDEDEEDGEDGEGDEEVDEEAAAEDGDAKVDEAEVPAAPLPVAARSNGLNPHETPPPVVTPVAKRRAKAKAN